MEARFRVARNPDDASRLPYLVWLPLEGGVVLKAREMWPRAARVFCAQDGSAWTDSAGLVDDAAVLLCRRRGAAIDLVLDRPRLARSQFIFTTARGRPAVWWQTQKTVQAANPGARVPRGRAPGRLLIAVDTREKYGWRFAGRSVELERRALPAGDYAAMAAGAILGVVERKTMENLATSLSDGSLVYQLQRLGEAGHAAVVVEASYPDLFRTQPGRGSWLADMLGRLAARYPEVPIIFAGSRRFAEEWTYRYFGALAGDGSAGDVGAESAPT
ncbi:MAG: ERCC4 domain-containing protein [Candidatus Dormibacteraeota bacterium]|uniref:ERCC4 domain-containing protein n=1 Tax=Candidatus Aeolococcus gillhamiae TaxID=3127015 RepID=A0A934N424_9BACT|nr:ERCC4 domain-containing protein [Candidatus Dormibacteraeota bacterium]